MSEQELGRLRQAVSRLMEAQEEVSDAAKRGLKFGDGAGEEDDEGFSSATFRLQESLVDVQDILEGAAEDVRSILGDAAEE